MRLHKKLRELGEYQNPTQKLDPTNKQAKTKQLATLEKSCIFLFLLDTTKKEFLHVLTVFC